MSQRYIGGLIYNPPGGYSGYFDGSGDYLSVGSNAAFTLGTGDFTIECWYYPSVSYASGNGYLFDLGSNGTRIQLYLNTVYFLPVAGSSIQSAAGVGMSLGWHHVAAVRSGSTMTLYVDGVSAGTTTNSSNLTDTLCRIGSAGYTGDYFNGYISSFRIVKGTAVYTSAFTPPNGPLQNITNTSLLTCRYPTFVDGSNNAFTITVNGNTTVSTQNPFPLTTLPNPAQGGAGNGIFSMSQYQSLKQQNLWPAIDPYFDYTTLLLHGNGTNGGQNNTFLDSGTANSGSGFTITRNGNTTQGTFSPFSQTGWSNYFGSGGASYLIANATDTSKFAFGTGDFTIEFWVYAEALTAPDGLVTFYDQRAASTDGVCPTIYYYSDQLLVYVQATNVIYGSSLSLNQWTHIALSRVSGNSRLFVNGVQTGSTYSDSNNYVAPSSNIRIFANCYGGSRSPTGYCSNFRVVKGTGLYSANFTPPTSPLTAITNTQLLTCQSNRFVDNSSNALTVTPYNTYSVQAFSPFAPTAAYSASTVGGSGYFDGSGDYLNTGSNTAFALGTGDFTWETWLYRTVSATQEIYTSMTTDGLIIYISGNAAVVRRFGVADLLTSSASIDLNTWTHIAVARSGTTLSMWINGSRSAGGTTTNSTNFAQSGLRIGINDVGSSAYTGYMSNLRVVKGTAVYDPTQTSITVPTAPLTNITNTSLLLNFTNAAIIDNTAKNVLETVGNAQISTSVSKFGGASLYFDGTGDYLLMPTTEAIKVGGGDFTIEFWLYWASSLTPSVYWASSTSSILITDSAATYAVICSSTDTASGYSKLIDAPSSLSANTWGHVAVVRSSGTTRIYLNGTVGGNTSSITGSFDCAWIGYQKNGGRALNGYIDDLRITKGIARYTSNFTPQTSQWQDQ